MTDLVTLAATAYAEDQRLTGTQLQDLAAQQAIDTVHYAQSAASAILGDVAAQALEFQPIAEPVAEGTIEAEADMPGKPGYGIRYVGGEGTDRLFLVRPCSHCGHVAVEEIRSLPLLGKLLASNPTA